MHRNHAPSTNQAANPKAEIDTLNERQLPSMAKKTCDNLQDKTRQAHEPHSQQLKIETKKPARPAAVVQILFRKKKKNATWRFLPCLALRQARRKWRVTAGRAMP